MVPLSMILREVKFHYEFDDKWTRLSHLLFIDDLKLFAKSHDQIVWLVNTVHKFSENTGMDFEITKCRVLVLKDKKLMKSIDGKG